MGIKKPDANPVVALLLCFILGLGHLIINGQQRKWMYLLICGFVIGIVGICLLGLPGLVFGVLSLIDAYQTAERLQKGEEIPENEYSQPLLFKIMSKIDKTATCKNAQ